MFLLFQGGIFEVQNVSFRFGIEIWQTFSIFSGFSPPIFEKYDPSRIFIMDPTPQFAGQKV